VGTASPQTTRIQEIENYGEPGQHALSEGEGNGFIWRIFSITRFEERDGGVYIELEVIALSRDIPISLRWIVEPIVRRVSITSLTTSLQQTGSAVPFGRDASRAQHTGGTVFCCDELCPRQCSQFRGNPLTPLSRW
jgi:hypothetical protein